jgi:hypothetical protein
MRIKVCFTCFLIITEDRALNPNTEEENNIKTRMPKNKKSKSGIGEASDEIIATARRASEAQSPVIASPSIHDTKSEAVSGTIE